LLCHLYVASFQLNCFSLSSGWLSVVVCVVACRSDCHPGQRTADFVVTRLRIGHAWFDRDPEPDHVGDWRRPAGRSAVDDGVFILEHNQRGGDHWPSSLGRGQERNVQLRERDCNLPGCWFQHYDNWNGTVATFAFTIAPGAAGSIPLTLSSTSATSAEEPRFPLQAREGRSP